ncbi:winged helix-turn-helix transcriptional regulator [Aureivirga sp. CE67]|uniref:winged helix-turn-helix transcriptional regulator n=1 Tax=Aureivirga sp. CE67 TaxID=1788983 RepID=UPI0018C8E90C|nr:winged helix-turn-helix transcriptional regulator [Aureivirga sp. CE67]
MTKIKESSTHFENKKTLEKECLIVYASNIIGGQWALSICCYLMDGKLRFGELKKLLPNITERMLTLQLRKLEKDQIVKRTVYAEVPPRVEYELTSVGYSLKPLMDSLETWGKMHQETVE